MLPNGGKLGSLAFSEIVLVLQKRPAPQAYPGHLLFHKPCFVNPTIRVLDNVKRICHDDSAGQSALHGMAPSILQVDAYGPNALTNRIRQMSQKALQRFHAVIRQDGQKAPFWPYARDRDHHVTAAIAVFINAQHEGIDIPEGFLEIYLLTYVPKE